MTPTTSILDNTATTWRDLADQLTPEQIAYMELSERHPVPMADGSHDEDRERRGHLFCAREFAAQNAAAAAYRHVPIPAGANRVGAWQQWDEDGSHSRLWFGFSQSVSISSGVFSAAVTGTQWSDGRLTRGVVLHGDDDSMTANEARQLAGALVAAADELDALNSEAR